MSEGSQLPLSADSPLRSVAGLLREGHSFLILTHKDPDIDGIGSMLALGKALVNASKEVVLFAEEPLASPLCLMKGAERIVHFLEARKPFDAVLMLDCSDEDRVGEVGRTLQSGETLINIDHHLSNDLYGDYNVVEAQSSSTGEIVYKILETAGFPLDSEIAENIFAAIQADTGCFRYDNTTSAALVICSEMVNYGIRPWELSRRLVDLYSLPRLKLLEAALGTIEFHLEGRVGMMTISEGMIQEAGATREDSEGFGDYPRCVPGVEVSVLIRQTGPEEYKFSLRSNDYVNVAKMAAGLGGGGHARAAGYKCYGDLGALKRRFLLEAQRFLNQAQEDAF